MNILKKISEIIQWQFLSIFVTILHFTFAPVETNDLLRFL